MAVDAETCPNCGHRVTDLERQDVGEGLLACDRCGDLFTRRSARPKRDTIGALYGGGEPAPRIHIAPDERIGQSETAAAAPAQSAPSRPRRPGTLSTVVWSLGILVLLFALLIQFAWHMREQLARHAPLRPLLTTLCEYAGCEIPLLRAPELIHMTARDIRRHPSARDALRISITFTNDAEFTQSWPEVLLTFYDLRDRVLAQRSFIPAEYLPQDVEESAGMPSRGTLQTMLEVVDPGPDAVNFTFAFQ
ncbi:MAG: DUF3426 domain-containing protein [Gammaproteobacteria bacterium]|jgi:hypothetical protein|nr:DUF3426 domain-containing protein [Gammaproteobacteria bacterium]